MELATVLANAQSPTADLRQQAEAFLQQATDQSYGQFLTALCVELATEGKPDQNRQIAGLYIKNLITAKDDAILQGKLQKWYDCETAQKDNIRLGFLKAIKSPIKAVNHTAAQILAAFGAVDLPRQEWPNLLPSLLQNVSAEDVPETCKIASLEALGYLCDAMEPDRVEKKEVDLILNTIIGGTRGGSDSIKLAAIKALNISLDFTEANFDILEERNAIMQAICEATQSQDVNIRENAFQCFVTIGEFYYNYLQAYITIIFELSLKAIREDDAAVATQAIDFWSAVSEAEYEKEDNENLQFVKAAAGQLIPLLLENMTKQIEDEGDESWSVNMAAAECLIKIALCEEDRVVEMVMPFIQANIVNENWHFKEASIMAFASILEGPSEEKMLPFVGQAIPVLVKYLSDPAEIVKHSSAWTISKIFELHHQVLTSPDILNGVVHGVAAALDDPSPKVVYQVCSAIVKLGEAYESSASMDTNALSPYFQPLIQKLFFVSKRADAGEENIGSTSFEAIASLVENSAKDMKKFLPLLLQEVVNLLTHANNGAQVSLQVSLVMIVGQIIQKLEKTDFNPDDIMQRLLQVLNAGGPAYSDAMLVIGHVVNVVGESSERYLEHLLPFIYDALRNFDDANLVVITLGVVGDIARELKTKLTVPICDQLMTILLELLHSPRLDRSVKPHVISVFSDIAMAIERDFHKYLEPVMSILKQAGDVVIEDPRDEDMVEYINELRGAILETYTGILFGLEKEKDKVLPWILSIVTFMKKAFSDESKSDDVVLHSIGLFGDIGKTYSNNPQVGELFRSEKAFIESLLTEGKNIVGSDAQAYGTIRYAEEIYRSVC